ncbi:sulfotransferase [Pseudomonas sp. CCOS 191]|uniref:sulfotransferase n=1 Tax=Pseudomonas sp. CCOS 191 TaxID=1649877 RepID=UPI0006249FE6|nr:sulfotransferase [Pseudomonas sp. CCOS 191]CRI59808.1 hypothetical protein CCOS191_5272 [Pseudomonas sp. CCOS 191]
MTENRTGDFRRNVLLEQLLLEMNADLQPSEQTLMAMQAPSCLPHPLILVMGPLRSGTTLFMQWLANTGTIAYPSNLLSRFYQAPIIGAKIQLLLTDPRYDFRGELCEFVQQAEYRSENGKTKGALAPNEFWYFWRRFLSASDQDIWTDEALRKGMNTQEMLRELSGMMAVFQKPFAAKGMLFNYNIPFLDSVLDKVLFVHIKRDEVANAASVLEARKRQLGDESKWYSFDIPEKDELTQLEPFEQALGQVRAINLAVESGLKHVAETRKMTVQYEDFCRAPARYFEQLTDKLGMTGVHYQGKSSFEATRTR